MIARLLEDSLCSSLSAITCISIENAPLLTMTASVIGDIQNFECDDVSGTWYALRLDYISFVLETGLAQPWTAKQLICVSANPLTEWNRSWAAQRMLDRKRKFDP